MSITKRKIKNMYITICVDVLIIDRITYMCDNSHEYKK